LDSQSVISYEESNQLFEKKDVELLKKVRMIIEENLDNPDFNIDSIAQSVGLSRSSFFKKLKNL
jgi:AraC-like DNA-binding protein